MSKKLRRITGFTKLIIFIDGLRIDLDQQPSQTVDVLFGQGILIVKIIGEECPKGEGKAKDSFEVSEPFRLLDLPPEIRDMITTRVVTKQPRKDWPPKQVPVPRRCEPALSMTCRQMRNESIGIFYRRTSFNVCLDDFDFKPLFTWLRDIGMVNSNAIERLFIDLYGDGWTNARYFLEAKEEMLTSTEVIFMGDNYHMDHAWSRAIDMGTGLRTAGLSWDQIETAFGHCTVIMDVSGFLDGGWPDDASLRSDIDSDTDSDVSDP